MSSAIEGIAATTKMMYSRQAYSEAPALTRRIAPTPAPSSPVSAPTTENREDQTAFTPAIDESRSEAVDMLREFMEEARTDVASVVETANSDLQMKNHSLRFRILSDSDEVQIQVVDTARDKVIRSIPADDMIALATKMRELSGVGAMVDHSR